MKFKYFLLLPFLMATQLIFSQQENEIMRDETRIDSLRLAIEKDPGNLELHDDYLKATKFAKWGAKEDPAFINQYKAWMKKYPKSAVLPYAVGHAYASKESPKAKPYLLKAVEIDPNFDKAYFDLWIDAERWGQFEKGQEYIGKASEIKPDDPNYAFYYASGFSNSDLAKYEKLSLEVAKRFPQSERGAQALYWLAARFKDPKKRIGFYEQLKNSFPPAKFGWSQSGMSGYYDLLLQRAPEKAVELARQMEQAMEKESEKKMWAANVATAQNIARAQSLMARNQPREAVAILEKTSVSRWSDAGNYLMLLKAKAYDAAGNTEAAYESLKMLFARQPKKEVEEALKAYGAKLGKNAQQVVADVWYVRDTAAKIATPFTLKKYLTPGSLSLSDLKGKVVLLTYWFPGCGPCRGEFPHFQNVVNKFKGEDFAYVGINIVPEQNEYVIPFMKSSGYTFIPIEDVEGRNKGNLDNRGAAPVNFLIDQEGRIMFSNIRTNEHNEDELELMIHSLLNRKQA